MPNLFRTMRQRATWLRDRLSFCIVLLSRLMAGVGVVFLDPTTLRWMNRLASGSFSGTDRQHTTASPSKPKVISPRAALTGPPQGVASSELRSQPVAMYVKLTPPGQRLGSFGAIPQSPAFGSLTPTQVGRRDQRTILRTADGGATWPCWFRAGTLNDLFLRAFHRPISAMGVCDKGTIVRR